MRATGKVKWFNEAKGFGFITTERASTCSCTPPRFRATVNVPSKEGEQVEFDLIQGPKGLQAANVVVM
jgi:cold shock protein